MSGLFYDLNLLNPAPAGFFIACNLEMIMNFLDPADESAEREQQLIEIALANRPAPQMTYTGECHYCEEPIAKGHFCSDECRCDHEKMVWAESQRRVA